MKYTKLLGVTLLSTALLFGCTGKDEAPASKDTVKENEVTQAVGKTGKLKLNLTWFSETDTGASLGFVDNDNKKYLDVGINSVVINVGTQITNENLKETELLYGQDYTVTFKDGEAVKLEKAEMGNVWEDYLHKDKVNLVILRGTEDIPVNDILAKVYEKITKEVNVTNDMNTVATVRDYTQWDIKLGETGVAIFDGDKFIDFITAVEEVEDFNLE